MASVTVWSNRVGSDHSTDDTVTSELMQCGPAQLRPSLILRPSTEHHFRVVWSSRKCSFGCGRRPRRAEQRKACSLPFAFARCNRSECNLDEERKGCRGNGSARNTLYMNGGCGVKKWRIAHAHTPRRAALQHDRTACTRHVRCQVGWGRCPPRANPSIIQHRCANCICRRGMRCGDTICSETTLL